MEKKSLGRGLEDIADIFMSQKREKFPADDTTSENDRETAGESYLEHSVEGPGGTTPFSEDDIFTVVDERLKVIRNRPNSKRLFAHDLSGRDDDLRTKNIQNNPEDCPDICEITQHVIREKRLGYLNTPDVQQNIVKSLSQYLRQDFIIKSIELVKMDEVSRPGVKNKIEENILIYIKEEENR